MHLLQSLRCLKRITDLNPVHEVFRYRLFWTFVLDLRFEDFEIHRAFRFTKVRLKNSICDFSLLFYTQNCRILHNTTGIHLGFIDLVQVAEELEDILSINWLSRGKITANGVLTVRD